MGYALIENQNKKVVLGLIGKIAPEADIENIDPAFQFRDPFDFDSVDFMNVAVAFLRGIQAGNPRG